jgi:hypothetical protein
MKAIAGIGYTYQGVFGKAFDTRGRWFSAQQTGNLLPGGFDSFFCINPIFVTAGRVPEITIDVREHCVCNGFV